MIPQRIPVLSGGFSLAAFMASQSAGFWYNFLRNDTMFQEDVGPTPADEPNEVIGLALSQRLWGGQTRAAYLAGQPELAPNNGQFNAWTDPTVPNGWQKVGTHNASNYVEQSPTGELHLVSDGTFVSITAAGPTVGRHYAVTVVISEVIDAAIAVTLGPGTDLIISTAGAYTRYITATADYFEIKRHAGSGAVDARVAEISVREVSRYAATQATASFKPKYQTAGAKFDGTDDNLLTGYAAGSGANFLVAKVVVPASLAATQVIVGSELGANILFLGVGTAGTLRYGYGGYVESVPGGEDLRGKTVVLGLSGEGAQARLFVRDQAVYEPTFTGAPSTTRPLRIGAGNAGGSPSNYWGGSIQHVLAGREFLDLARFIQIANALGV